MRVTESIIPVTFFWNGSSFFLIGPMTGLPQGGAIELIPICGIMYLR
jgi:hypothetical protein